MKPYQVTLIAKVVERWQRPEWVRDVRVSFAPLAEIPSVDVLIVGCCDVITLHVSRLKPHHSADSLAPLLLPDLDRYAEMLRVQLIARHEAARPQPPEPEPDDGRTLPELVADFAREKGIEPAPLVRPE